MVLCKIIQLPINFLLLGIAVNLFPAVLNVYASGDISVNTYWNTPHISFCFLLVCISFLITVDRKIGVFTIGKK